MVAVLIVCLQVDKFCRINTGITAPSIRILTNVSDLIIASNIRAIPPHVLDSETAQHISISQFDHLSLTAIKPDTQVSLLLCLMTQTEI